MEFRTIINAVGIGIQAQVPVLLVGDPGVAKTAIVGALFRQICEEHHTSIAALHEPPEYGGYPVPDHQRQVVALVPCDWVKRLAKVEGATKHAGLMLDELSSAPPATRSAAMRGIHEGTWGDVHIPRLSTVAAMNPPEIAENGYDLSAPLANRFCHVEWSMPVEYWVEQMVQDFPAPQVSRLPENWMRHWPTAKTYVAAFAHTRPGAIHMLPKSAVQRSQPWPSFRTWTMAARLVAACLSVGEDLESDATVTLVGGCVGPGSAHEFLTYSKELDLPDPEEVLKHPRKLKLPPRGDRSYAVLTGVVSAVLANLTIDRWNKGWEVLEVAVAQEKADIAAGAARALAKNRPPGSATLPKSVTAFVPILTAAGLMDK